MVLTKEKILEICKDSSYPFLKKIQNEEDVIALAERYKQSENRKNPEYRVLVEEASKCEQAEARNALGDNSLTTENIRKFLDNANTNVWGSFNEDFIASHPEIVLDGDSFQDSVDMNTFDWEKVFEFTKNNEDGFSLHYYDDYATIFLYFNADGLSIDCPFMNDNSETHLAEDLSDILEKEKTDKLSQLLQSEQKEECTIKHIEPQMVENLLKQGFAMDDIIQADKWYYFGCTMPDKDTDKNFYLNGNEAMRFISKDDYVLGMAMYFKTKEPYDLPIPDTNGQYTLRFEKNSQMHGYEYAGKGFDELVTKIRETQKKNNDARLLFSYEYEHNDGDQIFYETTHIFRYKDDRIMSFYHDGYNHLFDFSANELSKEDFLNKVKKVEEGAENRKAHNSRSGYCILTPLSKEDLSEIENDIYREDIER